MPEDDYFHNDRNIYYTETNVVGEDTETIAIGCTCSENSQCQNENESCQCIEMSGGILNYTSDGKLIVKENPIFECRPLCQCENCCNFYIDIVVCIQILDFLLLLLFHQTYN